MENTYKVNEEAVKKIAERVYDNGSTVINRNDLEEMFPELKESGDERIGKVLIDYFKIHKARGVNTFYEIPTDNVIAWLEKQGEQKPVISYDALREGIGHFGITQYQIDYWLKKYVDVEKQGEQKPYGQRQECVDCQFNYAGECKGSCTMKRGEQKPTDKVEPKFKVGDEIKAANEESLTITKIDDKGYWSEDLFICDFDGAVCWNLVEQKPAWSEEDEKMYAATIFALAGFMGNEDKLEWLKSLKDRYTWKPSEEQMVALDSICSYIRNKADWEISQDMVSDLYKLSEQLKKLKD